MKRTERMLREVSTRCMLSGLLWINEDKVKLNQEFQVWVGLRFALKKQQNVVMPKKED